MARPRKPRIPVAFGLASPGRRQLWEDVATGLREAILAGTIPAGASLVEADLAERFDVSRGPVRDALRELVREGILAELPRRGTVVATLTTSDIREVYAVREGLEIVASRLVIARAERSEIERIGVHVARMEEAWDRAADYTESLAEDLAFHRGLVQLSGNARLGTIYEQMLGQTELLMRGAVSANPSLANAMQRSAHRDVLDAVLERDPERARTALADHYAYAVERLYGGIDAVVT